MDIIKQIHEKSKSLHNKIVLPEATDLRVLKAAEIATKKKLAQIILIGKKKEIENISKENSIDISNITIIDHTTSNELDKYSEELFKLRKNKGMTIKKAKLLLEQEIYFATMMVHLNDANGVVSGAIHSTSDTIRPAFQIIGTKKNINIASGVFLMITNNNIYLFGDSAVNPNPDAEELAEIAECSAKTYEKLTGKKARVAMLSFSTHNSAKHDMVDKVIEATKIVKKRNPELIIDGELQIDAAIVPEVAKIKCPNSVIKGTANVLIFPDLNSGNIGYKIVERLANAKAVGPILQGLLKPINDLSRGCNVLDIVNMIAITSIMED